MRAALWVLLFLPTAAGAPQFYAVVPDLPGPGPGDEGVALWDPDGGLDWTGYRITDGEDTWTFPPVTGGRVWVVGDGTAWAAHGGPPPTFTDLGLSLANDGETVHLLDPAGREVDRFTWGPGGDVATRSPGLVYARYGDGWAAPRLHRIGESGLDRPTWPVTRLTLYSSPDSSFAVLRDLVLHAETRLHLHVYDLRHPELVDAMVAAKQEHPALDLQVLVDDRVVGHDARDKQETRAGLSRLVAAGARVVGVEGGRYTHHHLKVLIADDAVAVQSENWVESGVPRDPSMGNRGWGVVVHDGAAADWFAAWMADDRGAWDSRPFVPDPDAASLRMAPWRGENDPVPARTVTGSLRVTPLVAPDHTADPDTDPLLALLRGARSRIWTQQLRLGTEEANRLGWDAPDRYLEALADAAARGVDVRVQAAAPFSADDTANAEALAWLAERGVAVDVLDRDGLTTLHNKGWIVDEVVVLGSLNAHHVSRSQNREVDLVLEGDGVADFYAALLEPDWSPPERTTPLPILLVLGAVAWTLTRRIH